VTPTLGNNPLGVAIPAGSCHPILLDIAMSVATRGKIGLHLAAGNPLPSNWILDHRGRPSTNLADLAAGLGVTIGGHKGYGLTLVMEILSGVLSGAAFGREHRREQIRHLAEPPDIGHFFMVMDPEMFMPLPDFTARVVRMIEQIKSGERAENVDEILVPGEAELRARERSLRSGVRLTPATFHALKKYAAEVGMKTELAPIEPIGWER
jgi:LDH2 family malate/lactate/ureidoglycolate dehydrogenase